MYKPIENVKIVFLSLLCQKLGEDNHNTRFSKLKAVLKPLSMKSKVKKLEKLVFKLIFMNLMSISCF